MTEASKRLGIDDYLVELRRNAERLAQAAEQAGLQRLVPSCPGWTVYDLLAHTGGVQRWAASIVEHQLDHPPDRDQAAALFERVPADELIDWYRTSYTALVDTLAGARPDVSCWTFLPAASSLGFWARRQAHETTIHRVDAELAAGIEHQAIPSHFAADGIDELLCGLLARRSISMSCDQPVSISFTAADTADTWTMHLGPEPGVVELGASPMKEGAWCRVVGDAAEVYLVVWNRLDPQPGLSTLRVDGDMKILRAWREKAVIRMGRTN